MNTELPMSVTVGEREFKIRYEYGAALDILTAMDDSKLDDRDRVPTVLYIFYPDVSEMEPSEYQEALERLKWFLNIGQEEAPGAVNVRLVDWEQDFPLIVAAVNRVLGFDVRAHPELHWWTFYAAFMEIGDCAFAQVVSIRYKLAMGRTLEKPERAWYRQNKNLVDFKRKGPEKISPKYTKAEMDTIAKLI